ncbi:sulfite exporter TauE/SafE family protein [Actibacterium mucosum]|uniref:sulfite exporter TauE/SafE family protein n=1 Tax=Actibacterium mucosum TaxID=1087332 RepID=UPI000559427F|nr:sulfite exporter TauE/SafE family protein [Actibacterium mucosum]
MPELTTLLPIVAIMLAIGAFAGVLAGLLGVGGGIVLVPAFFYTFSALGYGGDYVMQICLATSLATIIVTSLRSVMSHNRKGAVDWDVLRRWSPGIVIGALLGVAVATRLDSSALQALFGTLGIVIGLYMAFGNPNWRLASAMPGGGVRWGVSTAIGLLSVLLGIGGGSLAVPTMTLCAYPIHRAVATAAGFGVVLAVPSVLGFLLVDIPAEMRPPLTIGAVNIPAFLIVISMTLITAPLGAKLAHAMDPKPLRRVFALFLMLVALNMLRELLAA